MNNNTANRLCVATIVAWIFSAAAPTWTVAQYIAFEDVSVVTMDGPTASPHHTVLVTNGKIVAIGPNDQVNVPRSANRIDGSGKFLIPGLADMHIHIGRNRTDAEHMLRMYLGMGITTVAVLNGHPLVLELRRQIANGELDGPTIISSGATLRRGPPNTRSEGAAVVREQAEAGYDLIKVYNGLPEEAYRGIMDEARELGVTVIGHAVRSVGIEGAIEESQHIAHMEEIVYGFFRRPGRPSANGLVSRPSLSEQLDSTLIPNLARRLRDADVWVIPNLVAYHWIQRQVADIDAALDRPEITLLPQRTQRDWSPQNNRYKRVANQARFLETLSTTFPFLQTLTRGFHDAGVRMLAGSDAPVPVTVPGYGLHEELQELVDAGLSPFDALSAATIAPAEFLGRANTGRIAEGAAADLLLLDANPLDDIAATRMIVGVMKDGRWFGPEEFSDLRALHAN